MYRSLCKWLLHRLPFVAVAVAFACFVHRGIYLFFHKLFAVISNNKNNQLEQQQQVNYYVIKVKQYPD